VRRFAGNDGKPRAPFARAEPPIPLRFTFYMTVKQLRSRTTWRCFTFYMTVKQLPRAR